MRSSVCHLLKLPRSFNCLMDLKVSHLTQNIYSVRQQYAAFGWNVLFVRMVSQVQAASARCSLSGLSMVTPNGICGNSMRAALAINTQAKLSRLLARLKRMENTTTFTCRMKNANQRGPCGHLLPITV